MEVPGGHSQKINVLIYEVLGTAFLLFAVNASASGLQPYAVSFTIFANIMMFGPVSGGHFNPAVSTAVFVKEGRKMREHAWFFVLILIAQVVGAIIGVLFMLIALRKDAASLTVSPGIAMLCPPNAEAPSTAADLSPDTNDTALTASPLCQTHGTGGQFFFTEFVCTFIFTNVILNVKYHFGSSELIPNAAAVALTLFAMLCVSSPLSGGCINPAVGLVQ